MARGKKQIIFYLWVMAISFSLAKAVLPAQESLPPGETGEILIKLKEQKDGSSEHVISAAISSLHQRLQVKAMERVFSPVSTKKEYVQSAVTGQDFPNDQGLSRWFSVKVDEGQNADELLQRYRDSGLVEYAEPIYTYTIASTPDDPYFASEGSWGQLYEDQWGLKSIQAEKAWNISSGSPETIVAVIDTGADYRHPDLRSNIWHNSAEIADNEIDDDHNGYVDDVIGWDFCDNTKNPRDGNGHGTHISGIIAAVGNNATGISGVCWQAKIMALKALTDNGGGISKQLAQAIKYAADNGARLINISWGGFGNSAVVKDALDYAYNHNCLIVAAAGNNNSDAGRFFPGNYSQAITVTACDANDKRASFTNYGTVVDVTAPGVDILSLRAEGTDMYQKETHIVGQYYYRASGTSMATPFVSGVAALIVSQNPLLANSEIEKILYASCEDLGETGKDKYFGYGKINAAKTMTLSGGEMVRVMEFAAFDTPSDNGDSITVQWTFPVEPRVKGYSVYYAHVPFNSITDDGVRFCQSSPLNNPSATECVISGLTEGQEYYVAVIATIESGETKLAPKAYSSADSSAVSSRDPVYPVHNIIRSSENADIIAAGMDYLTRAIIPRNADNENKILNITLPERVKEAQVAQADSRLSSLLQVEQTTELSASVVQFTSVGTLSGTVVIQLSYPAGIHGWQESNARIFYLQEEMATWEEVAGTQLVHREQNVVSVEMDGAALTQGKVFRVFSMAPALENLDQVAVYPNPYKPNSGLGHTKISFTNMLPSSLVKIYTLAGELVRTLEDNRGLGELDWDATNENGEKIASGIYVYFVDNHSGGHKIGKLAVIK